MFLFTTPTSPASQAPPPASPVVEAIRQGAERTGTDFDYLLRTAQRESALDPAAKAPTSSATGLFQFIEQTWLGLVKSEGDKIGLGSEAKAVTARPDGSFAVADPSAREAILKLREDPEVAAAMAGNLTQQNRDALRGSLGREPTGGELYMAHVFGARGAADLIGAARSTPTRSAASDFPEAARANRPIFFDRSGRPRGMAEVYGLLAATPAGTVAAAASAPPAASTTATATSAGNVTVTTDTRSTGLRNLFQTGARPGPISDAVARIWRTNNGEGRVRTASLSFFPRTVAGAEPEAAAAEAGIASAEAVSAAAGAAPADSATSPPLPPARPRSLRPVGPAAGPGSGRPLDLALFMRTRTR